MDNQRKLTVNKKTQKKPDTLFFINTIQKKHWKSPKKQISLFKIAMNRINHNFPKKSITSTRNLTS